MSPSADRRGPRERVRSFVPSVEPACLFDDSLQCRAQLRAKVSAFKPIGDISGKETDLVPAVIGGTGKFQSPEILFGEKADHGIGDLDFAAGTRRLILDLGKDLWLQDVAAGDDKVGWRLGAGRFFDHGGDAHCTASFLGDADYAIAAHLVPWHLFNSDDIAALAVVYRHHLFEAAWLGVDQHVRQDQGEGFVANQFAGAPYGVAETKRLLLAREACLAGH